MKYSIVIPCYNEEKNIKPLIEKCYSILRDDLEIILLDNGSTDNSRSIFSSYKKIYKKIRFLKLNKNKGYGNGILFALKQAKGDIIGWTHADLQTDPGDIIKAISFFELNTDPLFVKGTRKGRPFTDNFFTFFMTIFESLLLRTIMFDINAQPTLFNKQFFKIWKNPPKDFSLDLYAYYMAKTQKIKIVRFPVFFHKRIYGVSSWNIGFISKYKFIKRTIQYSLTMKSHLKK